MTRSLLSSCLLCALLSMAGPARAVPECFEESPALADQGEAYFAPRETLSSRERRKLRSVLRDVRGSWTGETVFLSCRGNAIHHEEVFEEGTVVVEFDRMKNGALALAALVDYSNGEKNVAVEFTSGSDRELDSLEQLERGIRFSGKFHQPRGDSSVLVENTIEIRTRDENLTLVRRTYIDGLLESAQIFGVTRK